MDWSHPASLDRQDTRLCYHRFGDGDGVLLIQGVGARGEVWRPQVEALAGRYTVVTFDNRGVGGSGLGSGPLTIEAMAEDALAVMDATGLTRFHVVGHSMGGVIAQAVALRAPERVRSLALLCTFARGRQATRLSLDIVMTGLRTRIGSRRSRRRAFLELVVPPELLAHRGSEALAEEFGRLFDRDLADQPPIVLKQLGAMKRYDALARLGSLGALPTLVVSAELDRIALPSFGKELAAAIPGARFVELPGLAHSCPIDAAPQVNALLGDHLREADRR